MIKYAYGTMFKCTTIIHLLVLINDIIGMRLTDSIGNTLFEFVDRTSLDVRVLTTILRKLGSNCIVKNECRLSLSL